MVFAMLGGLLASVHHGLITRTETEVSTGNGDPSLPTARLALLFSLSASTFYKYVGGGCVEESSTKSRSGDPIASMELVAPPLVGL